MWWHSRVALAYVDCDDTRYRKAELKDEINTKFLQWYLRIKRRVIRVVLFFVTVSYMPVARVILDNWAGQYVVV